MDARRLSLLTACAATVFLSACGGDSSPAPAPTPPAPAPTPASAFTQSATWTFALPAPGDSLCYDVDAKAEVPGCGGTAWDLKVTSTGAAATLWTNSGTSGSGDGGAFGGPFDHTWTELSAWQDGTTDPVNGAIPATLFFPDAASGVFTGTNDIQSAAFEYGVGGGADHLLYPNYRVFLVTTDDTSAATTSAGDVHVFQLQVTGYYGGAGGTASGHPSIRWVDSAAPATVRTATLDASTDWVYFDLVNGAEVAPDGAWQIAFNRYNVKLNGGASGGGGVGGFVGGTPAGFYDADGRPIAARFQSATPADTLAELTASGLARPASAADWVTDGTSSSLDPAYTGTYPGALDYGWYTYYPTAEAASAAGLPAVAHLVKADDAKASLLRTGEGTGYARFHLNGIAYADPADASSRQTWTVQFDVQPSK